MNTGNDSCSERKKKKNAYMMHIQPSEFLQTVSNIISTVPHDINNVRLENEMETAFFREIFFTNSIRLLRRLLEVVIIKYVPEYSSSRFFLLQLHSSLNSGSELVTDTIPW